MTKFSATILTDGIYDNDFRIFRSNDRLYESIDRMIRIYSDRKSVAEYQDGIGTYKYTAIDGSIHTEGVGETEVVDRALLCLDEPSESCRNEEYPWVLVGLL